MLLVHWYRGTLPSRNKEATS